MIKLLPTFVLATGSNIDALDLISHWTNDTSFG